MDMLTLQAAAPNRTEAQENKGSAKSEQSETSNYFSLPIHSFLLTLMQSMGILPINFNRRKIWVGLRFPVSAHNNTDAFQTTLRKNKKGQIPSYCDNRRGDSLHYHVILKFRICFVPWHVFLSSIKLMFSSLTEGPSGKEHRRKPSTQTTPRRLLTFPTSYLPKWKNHVFKQQEKTAINMCFPKHRGWIQTELWTLLNECLRRMLILLLWRTSAKGCTDCPALATFIFLSHPFFHQGSCCCSTWACWPFH